MASTILASRNNNHTSCGMGEIPNYSNNNNNHPRHLNPNPNRKPKSDKKKHLPNGRPYNHNSFDSSVIANQAGSDDAYSYNERPIECDWFDHGAYVTYNVSSCSRSEIIELRRKLAADLERIRRLNDRIQVGDVNPRLSNGKFKKLTGNKRFGSGNKEAKNLRKGLGEGDESLMKMCRQVLTKLMKHKLSWIFKEPVNAEALGLHDYHQIIKRPMDLGSVKSNLTRNEYLSPMELASDVRLVFENAMLYNPKTDKVHGMADQLLTYFEGLFRPIEAKLADVSNVNGFSAVDEFDGSSWDDIRSPERAKKPKTSGSVEPFVSNKQNHSSASNLVAPPVVQSVQSPVRSLSPMRVVQSPVQSRSPMRVVQPPVQSRSPMRVVQPPMRNLSPMHVVQSPVRSRSPMQAAELEPIKTSSTTARGAQPKLPKLPKPRAKDPVKRDMNMEEKQKLGLGLQSMPPEKMPQLLQIIRKRNSQLAQEGDEIELDIEALDTETLWELDRFVTNWKKHVSKTQRQALLVNNMSAEIDIDIDDVPWSDGVKKNKKEAGEEDVDIGDEMPESSFPHVEIEKDDGGGGQGQAAAGHVNDNASSSSSGSSSSSSGDSSSSSDSDSGSSSGSDSDADEAQS